jgi:H+/gluconate symporter-like permease
MEFITPTVQKSVKEVWIKIGTMMLIAQYVKKQSLTDMSFIKELVATFVGLAVFEIVAQQIKNRYQYSKNTMTAILDAVKITILSTVTRTAFGMDIQDSGWIKETGMSVAAFVIYDLYVEPYVATYLKKYTGKEKNVVHDWFKFGIAFTIGRLLNGQPINHEFIIQTGVTLVGFSIYDITLL